MACAGSTDPEQPAREETSFDSTRPYELHPAVALRRERFGALAYSYANRRLNFLRSSQLADLVESLSSHTSAEAALAAAEVPPERRPPLRAALAALLSSEVIRAR